MHPNALANWDHLSKREIHSLQLRRLKTFLTHRVLPFSPYYRMRLRAAGFDPESLRSLHDLNRIPFTNKSDLLPGESNPDGPRSFILQPSQELIRTALPRSELVKILARKWIRGDAGLRADLIAEFNPVTMLFTTGRSASSIPFFLSQYDLEILRVTGRRITEVLGLVPAEDKVVSLFPYAPHLAFWQVAECGSAGGIMTLSTGGGRVMGAERILGVIEKLRPSVICGMPGYFYHILRRARDEGRTWSFVRKIALGGEAVTQAMKERITEILREMGATDPRVASVYGFTEARQCWAECCAADNTGFHLSPELSLVEIIDPVTGEPVDDGESGELVYTTLDGRGSVVLRYRTGDIIEGGLTHEPCPGCGRTLPRVSSTIRRVSNVRNLSLSKVKGTLVNFNAVAELLNSRREIEEWQITISKHNDDPLDVDVLALRCALRPGVDEESFRVAVQGQMVLLTEVRFNEVHFAGLSELLERVGMDVNMKEERILDRRPAAGTEVGRV